MSYKEVQLFF